MFLPLNVYRDKVNILSGLLLSRIHSDICDWSKLTYFEKYKIRFVLDTDEVVCGVAMPFPLFRKVSSGLMGLEIL